MLRSPKDEKRKTSRKRMLKGGVILFSDRHVTLPCVVRDISTDGARLQVDHGLASVPDTELMIELDGLEVKCEVVRREPNGVGVRFLEAPTIATPRRSQSIWQTGRTSRPTLRKAPVAPIASIEPEQKFRPSKRHGIVSPVRKPHVIPIAIAEDDPDDRLLLEDAFRESNFRHPCTFVANGEELLKLLRGTPPYQAHPKPALILLDLNMPRMDGHTALMHIRTDPALRHIPVIVITTSREDDDISRTYDLGVSAYIPKPSTQDGLTELVECLERYWLRMVTLPAAAVA